MLHHSELVTRLQEKAAKTVLYAIKIKDRPDLSKLSEKKRIAYDCMVDAVDRVDGLDEMVKENWVGWFYYSMRMINDDQVDKLAYTFHDSISDYLLLYFTKDFNEANKAKLPIKRKISPGLQLDKSFDVYRM